MTKDFIANLLINKSKQTMIDSIDNTDDIDFLKKELKKQLRENWNRQEDKVNLIKYLEDKIYSIQPKGTYINFFPADGYDSEEDMIRANVEYNVLKELQAILERIKNNNYD